MNKEEQLLEKRLIELSNLAFSRDIVTFSDFLNLNELNILHRTPKDQFKARFETYGGYELAERQMVAFLPDALYYDYGYPMQALKICPVKKDINTLFMLAGKRKICNFFIGEDGSK